ncbi:MAG: ribose-5-phosphate isomerase RpiA [Bacteroidota bacterium]|nr:ribose-5-phosphate isomerase RpiA [Bacteroidota bacterium]MDP4211670.1 ribose-5-phosphate isomerase RpiA [Bacteroidota bacterium]MDP4250453.1 ribose-5-phosphate isomerase RpiA [Bacteroidota bacterium]
MNAKKLAAEKAVSFLENGMTVGLGTGSTAYWAIEKIGEKVNKDKWKIRAIATSLRSEEQARSLGIPILSFAEIDVIDVTIDGADEVDGQLHLIKGGGGALLREKIVATNSRQMIVVADESKKVKTLGKFPLPVEVVIFGWERTFEKLKKLGCNPGRRMNQAEPYLTDNGNYIVDCAFGEINDPAGLHEQINAITGVVDNGLFIHIASKLVLGFENGNTQVISG